MIETKTMLGHLMSVAEGDRTVTRRVIIKLPFIDFKIEVEPNCFLCQYYYAIKEISVGGRCVCNGHAYVCPPSKDDPDLLKCKCEHNTAGTNCDKCADGYVAKPWRRYN